MNKGLRVNLLKVVLAFTLFAGAAFAAVFSFICSGEKYTIYLVTNDSPPQVTERCNFLGPLLALLYDDSHSVLRITDTTVDPEPTIGGTVALRVTIESRENLPAANLKITLPQGVELVSGGLNWTGPLIGGQQKTHTVSLRVVETGDWRVAIETFVGDMGGSERGEMNNIYFVATGEKVYAIPDRMYGLAAQP